MFGSCVVSVRLQQPRGRHTGTGTHTLSVDFVLWASDLRGLRFRTSGESSPHPPPFPTLFHRGGVREHGTVLYGLNFSTETEALACSMMMWRGGGALNFDAALSMLIDACVSLVALGA